MPEQAQLFDVGAGTARVAVPTRGREEFLAGLFSTWAAIDRDGPNAKPTTEEKRRGREAAKAALGEILR